jgi:hypothetical protein
MIDRVISERRIERDLEVRGCGLILRSYPGIHPEELRRTTNPPKSG